jgi:hypothetical protein
LIDGDDCLIADFGFPIRSKRLPSGAFESQRESEDWHFSRGMATLGLKTMVTRRVGTNHFGLKGYRNDYPWGRLESDTATRSKWGEE